MTQTTTSPEVKSNLVFSKEIVNWVAFRRFCDFLKESLITAEKTDRALVVEIWDFPKSKPPKQKGI